MANLSFFAEEFHISQMIRRMSHSVYSYISVFNHCWPIFGEAVSVLGAADSEEIHQIVETQDRKMMKLLFSWGVVSMMKLENHHLNIICARKVLES